MTQHCRWLEGRSLCLARMQKAAEMKVSVKAVVWPSTLTLKASPGTWRGLSETKIAGERLTYRCVQ